MKKVDSTPYTRGSKLMKCFNGVVNRFTIVTNDFNGWAGWLKLYVDGQRRRFLP